MLRPIRISEARKIVAKHTMEPEIEYVKPSEAVGRVLAKDAIAPMDLPPFDRAAMDGIAVNSEDSRSLVLSRREPILTGRPLPDRADAVVPLESFRLVGDQAFLDRPVHKRENVDPRGSDVAKGEVMLKRGTLIRANHVPALALAFDEVPVYRLDFTLIIVGSEIRPFGELKDLDGPSVESLIRLYGGNVKRIIRVPDDEGEIEKALMEADGAIVTTGGTSVGDKDLVPKVLERIGEVLVHGIKAKPCKPFTFSVIDGRPVFSLPGPPVACFIAADLFVGPRIRLSLGLKPERIWLKRRSELARPIPSKPDRRDFVRVQERDGKLYPLGSGAGRIVTLYPADGYLEVPEELEGLEAGEIVERRDLRRRKISRISSSSTSSSSSSISNSFSSFSISSFTLLMSSSIFLISFSTSSNSF